MAVRYKKTTDPFVTDGRDIDTDVAQLSGEAATQRASGSNDKHIARIEGRGWHKLPEPQQAEGTYYERPLLNEPIWEWAIPTYYYVGGLTGASLVLAAGAQLTGSRRNSRLIKVCRIIGFAGACLSGALLIYDLGRPARFFNMLRVFRPTSPMNVGAWILSAVGASSSLSVLFPFESAAAKLSGLAAGTFGMGLATYTGVLVSNSAIPLWQESRRVLPLLFGSSAMASVGCAFEMLNADGSAATITRLFGITGQLAEIASAFALEKQASVIPRVALPLKRGFSGFLWRTSAALTATSVAIAFLPSKARGKRIAAGALGSLGSLLMRFAIEHAGVISSRDARASFHLQRARKK